MKLKVKGFRIKEQLLIFLLVLPQLKPESLDHIMPSLDLLFNIGRIISFAVIFLLYLQKGRKPSRIVISILFLQAWIIVTTLANNGDIHRAFFSMLFTAVIVLVIDYFPMKSVLPALMANFEWLIYVNLATLIFIPQGLYRQGVHSEFVDYFLGFKNSFFCYCLVAILLSGLNIIIQKGRIRPLLLMIASFLSVFIAWSASSVVALSVTLIMFLFIIVFKKPKFLTKIKFSQLFFVSVIIDILISVYNIVENSPIISGFVQNVLHKHVTLSGRTVIWEKASNMIMQRPFIGYGIGEHITWSGYDWYGHNQYYEMLLEGGIPCLILFLIVVYIVGKQMSLCKNRMIYNIFIATFSGLFVFYLAEAGTGMVFYIIYVLAFHIDTIQNLIPSNKYSSIREGIRQK